MRNYSDNSDRGNARNFTVDRSIVTSNSCLLPQTPGGACGDQEKDHRGTQKASGGPRKRPRFWPRNGPGRIMEGAVIVIIQTGAMPEITLQTGE